MGLLPYDRGHIHSSSPSPSTSSTPAPSKRQSAKNVAKATLILLEKAAEASNIPILKGTVGAVIEVIKMAEKRESNKESLDELVGYLRRLEDAIITPLLTGQSVDVSSELETRIRRLASKLASFANDRKVLNASHKRILSFVNHDDYSAEIATLNRLIRESLDAFSLETQIAATMTAENIRHNVARVVNHLVSKEIRDLPHVDAAYDSISRSDAPRCFQGTRVGVFNALKSWITDKTGPAACILEGIAGAGKTTIAQTLAEDEAEINRLAATFFFSRDENGRNNADLVFTTIAYQLAQHSKEFADRVDILLQKSPDAPRKNLTEQLRKLIVEPLQDLPLSASHPNIIIIDAIDECENQGASRILQLILTHLPFFKVLITTRPEHHICAILRTHTTHKRLVLHEMDKMAVKDDIRRYLKHQLTCQEVQKAVPGCKWELKNKDLDALVEASGQLFIIASTAERFIKHPVQRDPHHQLQVLFGAFGSSKTQKNSDLSPHSALDRLYDQVLDTAMPQSDSSANIMERFQKVVGSIITLQDPLLPEPLAVLLELNVSSISAVLPRLQSVVASSEDDRCPRIHHPSFVDFITTPSRCKQHRFLIEPAKHHSRMAGHCFNLMKRMLKKNICGLTRTSQYLENSKIPGLQTKIAEHIPAELVYACLYWAVHLDKAQDAEEGLLNLLETFTSSHLLYWLEVLSLTGNVRSSYPALILAQKFATSQDAPAGVWTLLADGQRFIMAFQEIITTSALHIYYSALPFTPGETSLFKTYHRERENSIRVLQGQGRGWDPLLAVLAGHSSCVWCSAFTLDGTRLASGSDDNTVRLWDGTTGAPVATLQGHSKRVRYLVFTADGRRLASGSGDQTVRLWDAITGAHTATLEGHTGEINTCAFTPDGKRLASGSSDNTVRLWGAATGTPITTLKGHSDWICCLAYTTDGKRLASGSEDKTVRLWNGETGAHITVLTHSSCVLCVAFTADGSRLASGSSDKTIRLWNGVTGALLATLQGHSDWVRCLSFTLDGGHLASGSDDHSIRLWNGVTGNSITTLRGHSGRVNSLAFTSDGKRLASASSDKTVRLWNGRTGSPIVALEGHSDWVYCVSLSPDGSRLASGSGDSTVRLWDGTTNDCATISKGHSQRVACLVFTIDGEHLATGSDDNSIKLWDGATGSPISTLNGHSKKINSLAFTSDGKHLASGSSDKTVRVWDVITGDCIAVLEGHLTCVISVAFTFGGTRVISQSKDDAVRLWDPTTAARITPIEGSSDQLNQALLTNATTPTPSCLALHIPEGSATNSVVAVSRGTITPMSICLLPLGSSISSFASTTARIAVGLRNGQVLIIDAARAISC